MLRFRERRLSGLSVLSDVGTQALVSYSELSFLLYNNTRYPSFSRPKMQVTNSNPFFIYLSAAGHKNPTCNGQRNPPSCTSCIFPYLTPTRTLTLTIKLHASSIERKSTSLNSSALPVWQPRYDSQVLIGYWYSREFSMQLQKAQHKTEIIFWRKFENRLFQVFCQIFCNMTTCW